MATSFTIGGTALTTYGKVLQAGYLDTPQRRGENVIIPFAHGRIFSQKYYDERTIAFEMSLPATTPTTLESTVDALKTKLAVMTELTLAMTMEDATIRNISVSLDDVITPQRQTPRTIQYTMLFKAASAFWRLSTAIADNTTTINANPKAMTVTNPGTVAEFEPTMILTGPLSNTVITNSTNGYVLTYTGTIASPRVVTIQRTSGQWVASNDLNANVIGNITHTPGAELMRINQGSNTMSIADGTATTGTVKITFSAPFT